MTDTNLPAERGPDNMTTAVAGGMGFGGPGGFDIAPKSLGEVVGFAKLMSTANHAIPAHLRNNPGACMAVSLQALGWEMSPFAVAQKSYKVGDTIAYEAQLIAAVVNSRANLKNRPLIEYLGEGPTRQCRVTLTFRNGDVRDYLSPMVKDIKVKNSPLWQSDPDQQLSYFSLRSAARRHCPEVILGVYDRDELEASEPMPERPDPRAPRSLRAKLTDQSGKQGFDPNHVHAQTAAEPEAEAEATPDAEGVIEGEAAEVVLEKVAEAEPQSEAEQKNNLAAALATLDKKPAEPAADKVPETVEAKPEPITDPAPEPGQDGPDALEDADDLIRQNAYDDGYAGDPIEPVLSMCENEQEKAVAEAAYEEGRKARIEKEAADHAASEAAAAEAATTKAEAPEIEDKAGPAPAGEKYLLGTEEPGADGKLNLYQDGEVFSRIPASAAAGKYDRYDGHPQPSDPRLASQGGGTGVQAPAEPEAPAATEAAEDAPLDPSTDPEAVTGTTIRPNGLYQDLAALDSWLQIKPKLTELYGSADFKALSPEDQAATRAHLFGAVLEMKDRTRDPVDWAQDAACFGLWLDWKAASSDSRADKREAIQGTFQTLQGGAMWTKRLTDAQRTALEARVAAVLSKIG